MNEPQSMLHKTCAFLEYLECVEKAKSTEDKSLRCSYLLSMMFIIYCNTIGTTKKPFNPLLGETFDYYDEKFKFRLISEQVSHHPPISAYFGENDDYSI